MSQKPRIPPKVKEQIGEIAIKSNLKRKKLVPLIKNQLRNHGYRVPADETIEKMISKARNEVTEEDKPWMLGTSTFYEIPAESLLAVIKVWRFCLATDRPFTIREAQWVIRLYTVISDTLDLWTWASLYATRERVSGGSFRLKKTFDTSDLDVALAMQPLELATTRLVGKVGPIESLVESNFVAMPINIEDLSGIYAAGSAMATIYADYWTEAAADEKIEIPEGWSDRWRAGRTQINSMMKMLPDLSGEAAWVFAYWLMYLMKGPKWQRLKFEKQIEVTHFLWKWVTKHPWNTSIKESLRIKVVRNRVKDPELIPTELLKMVGYKN